MLYNKIIAGIEERKLLALLVDPEEYNEKALYGLCQKISKAKPDLIFVGGSLVSERLDTAIEIIQSELDVPVLLFPGSLMQLSDKADGLLLLSLISGRNPEYLIGNHVLAAPFIRKKKIETIPTGYILVDGGNVTAVQYISNTLPIPANKPEIAVATAMAGEMLGQKLIYLESGSGAREPASFGLINQVKQNISIPLIVGGGIRSASELERTYSAGADIVVVGNSIEKDPGLIYDFCLVSRQENYHQ